MAALSNDRHEQFARAVAAGIPAKYAYQMAGFSSRRAGDAYRLAERPEMMIRIAELTRAMNPTPMAGLGFAHVAVELQRLAASIDRLAANAECAA